MNYIFKEIDYAEIVEDTQKTLVYDIELEKNSYFPANGIVSHNCRLISDMEMMDLASQSNSFGGGGSTSIGSHRVITINFARLAYQATSLDHFQEIVIKRIEDCAKILKAHKQLITWLNKQKLQPFIESGWIRLDRMFSTFGMIGLVEATEILQSKFDFNIDIIDKTLDIYNEYMIQYCKKYEIIGNIEQIPGESMMLRLPKADKLIIPTALFDIYSNQLIPLWNIDATLFERITIDGKYNKKITGGGIVHLNVGEEPLPEQNKILVEKAVSAGCEHFSVTGTYSLCANNHKSLGDYTICPLCGADIVEKRARTVGFWTNLIDWVKKKVILDHDRRKTYTKKDING